MKISVFSKMNSESTYELCKNTIDVLSKFCEKVYICEKFKDRFDANVCFAKEDELMSLCDLAIAIGGDGTTLFVAKEAAISGKMVLGINAGRLGFMSGLEKNELDLLNKLANLPFFTLDDFSSVSFSISSISSSSSSTLPTSSSII